MPKPKVVFTAGQEVGWLTLRSMFKTEKKPGRTGDRWVAYCRCGVAHNVAHEQLQTQRVMACRNCAKAYRHEEDMRMSL